MSLKAFGILPDISHNTLFRRQNGSPGVYMSFCLAAIGGSPKTVKVCELMDKSMVDNRSEILDCTKKCKDDACNDNCSKSILGVDIGAVQNSPFSKAKTECNKGGDLMMACSTSCRKNDLSCYGKCSDKHKFDNVPCISEKLDASEDQVKEMIDCPEKKCADSTDIGEVFNCFKDCTQPQGSTDNNKDSKNQSGASNSSDPKSKQGDQSSIPNRSSSSDSKSVNNSASSRLTTSNLITFGLIFLSLSLNIQ